MHAIVGVSVLDQSLFGYVELCFVELLEHGIICLKAGPHGMWLSQMWLFPATSDVGLSCRWQMGLFPAVSDVGLSCREQHSSNWWWTMPFASRRQTSAGGGIPPVIGSLASGNEAIMTFIIVLLKGMQFFQRTEAQG